MGLKKKYDRKSGTPEGSPLQYLCQWSSVFLLPVLTEHLQERENFVELLICHDYCNAGIFFAQVLE